MFTAWADICLGFLLVHDELQPPTQFVSLILATTGLYLAGMVFNDIFDRGLDAQERPQRPLPSGRITLRKALLFGGSLLVMGLLGAANAGWLCLVMATLLTVTIFAYDGGLKRTLIGPVVMGSCRTLNVLLGASGAATSWAGLWEMPQLWAALCLGVYIAGVTWFARTEATESRRWSLLGAIVTIDVGLGGLLCWAGRVGPLLKWKGAGQPMVAVSILAVIALTLNRRALAAIATPKPEFVQAGVKIMLWSIITLDAALIYLQRGDSHTPYALAVVGLLMPTMLLRRIAIT